MENKNIYLKVSLILAVLGFIILFLNNDLALSLKATYLADKGFKEIIENQIFKNYSYMFLIIGGVLFSIGIYNLTKLKESN
ncbi:hypothetical protein IR152_19010 [Clostridioides sp. ES-S-0108-01]|uniref:hypothetical protein n=1 Tax=unclassified Clostridioides TaxID=2635829 RepID=UPI001D0CD9CF|nr:hypothetical protein [Clostridioides sp. ES-S-0107-01]MCC0785090.1 hypothetical protein [Clostridioides sp. ES-S-0108-01]UDN53137.1 hypothetical protein JJC16_19245 [Clostridioides sp. ES-S-0107-01]